MSSETRVAQACPACQKSGLEMRTELVEEPYFGEVLHTMLKCSTCGFKHASSVVLRQGEPRRVSYKARNVDDLLVRIVRANTATIRVPELGVTIEPTHLSESFVSNLEGVLERVDSMLRRVLVLAEEATHRERALELLENVAKARDGRFTFTVILEDPLGNSDILGEHAKRESLTAEEVATLSTGLHVLDVTK